jgi:ribosome modulation factor
MGAPLEAALLKGVLAGLRGKRKSSCPYKDKRGGIYWHRVTWSRAFIGVWMDGWEQGVQMKNESEADNE